MGHSVAGRLLPKLRGGDGLHRSSRHEAVRLSSGAFLFAHMDQNSSAPCDFFVLCRTAIRKRFVAAFSHGSIAEGRVIAAHMLDTTCMNSQTIGLPVRLRCWPFRGWSYLFFRIPEVRSRSRVDIFFFLNRNKCIGTVRFAVLPLLSIHAKVHYRSRATNYYTITPENTTIPNKKNLAPKVVPDNVRQVRPKCNAHHATSSFTP